MKVINFFNKLSASFGPRKWRSDKLANALRKEREDRSFWATIKSIEDDPIKYSMEDGWPNK